MHNNCRHFVLLFYMLNFYWRINLIQIYMYMYMRGIPYIHSEYYFVYRHLKILKSKRFTCQNNHLSS